MNPRSIDRDWLAANPLPTPNDGHDKNSRGRVLVVGGAEFVPGTLRLTGEAALRAGAGKLKMATVRSVAMSHGVLVPGRSTGTRGGQGWGGTCHSRVGARQ